MIELFEKGNKLIEWFSKKHIIILFFYTISICSVQIVFGQNNVENQWVKQVSDASNDLKDSIYGQSTPIQVITSPAKSDVLLPSQQAVPPKEGEEVGWWKLPGVIVAGNDDVCGFTWDGSQLWVANNSYGKFKGKAFRLDINSAAYGSTPDITRVIDYAGTGVEGMDHDHNGHLYIGMRHKGPDSSAIILKVNGKSYKEFRSSASIVKYDDLTGTELKRYSSFSYPNDLTVCNSYTDADGTVLDHKGNLYWCVKGDHYKECNPKVANTAVQMMTLSGKIVKRFWLPWYYATPTFHNGYFIYKKGGRFTNTPLVYPYPEDSIEIVKIDGIQNNTTASISKTIKISGTHYYSDKRYLDATYFDDHLYLINQDTDPIYIIKIYLPLE